MASFVYTPAKTKFANGDIDLTNDDIRVALCMTNTTADTDQDVENIADIGTLDEMDGANYVRKALASEAVVEDAGNNRAEFTSTTPVTWTALGAGTRSIAGVLMYKHVTNDADAVLIAWIEPTGVPLAANGGDISLAMNAEGWLQVT